ncbi:hypothetical protein OAN76_02460 [Candidatus Marinimicrobia bacterium]|nr:hypothetical protein [Candidatus Neomarinimicrobiota bacterium]
MKTPLIKKIAPFLTRRKKEHRKLSIIHLEDFDLNDFLYHRENRN